LTDKEEYDTIQIRVQRPKKRVWRCECGTELISKPLDADTFMRIPNFTHCPICIEGTMIKQDGESND